MSDCPSPAPAQLKMQKRKKNTLWLRVHFEVKDYGMAGLWLLSSTKGPFLLPLGCSLLLLLGRKWRQTMQSQCLKTVLSMPPLPFTPCSPQLKEYFTENRPFEYEILISRGFEIWLWKMCLHLCGEQQLYLTWINNSYRRSEGWYCKNSMKSSKETSETTPPAYNPLPADILSQEVGRLWNGNCVFSYILEKLYVFWTDQHWRLRCKMCQNISWASVHSICYHIFHVNQMTDVTHLFVQTY